MRGVVQRVKSASVTIDDVRVAGISKGILLLVGIAADDTDESMNYIIDKTINLRIFQDENDKMNLSLIDVLGELIVVPNFTLYGDARCGRRPSYTSGASPDAADALFEKFVSKMRERFPSVQTGVFQADMQVEIINDGPVTIMLDSSKLF